MSETARHHKTTSISAPPEIAIFVNPIFIYLDHLLLHNNKWFYLYPA